MGFVHNFDLIHKFLRLYWQIYMSPQTKLTCKT